MFDLAVTGGGPAGYTAALNAAEKGMRVILFENDRIGGTCLNHGCVPTKFLMHASRRYFETGRIPLNDTFSEDKTDRGGYF